MLIALCSYFASSDVPASLSIGPQAASPKIHPAQPQILTKYEPRRTHDPHFLLAKSSVTSARPGCLFRQRHGSNHQDTTTSRRIMLQLWVVDQGLADATKVADAKPHTPGAAASPQCCCCDLHKLHTNIARDLKIMHSQ